MLFGNFTKVASWRATTSSLLEDDLERGAVFGGLLRSGLGGLQRRPLIDALALERLFIASPYFSSEAHAGSGAFACV